MGKSTTGRWGGNHYFLEIDGVSKKSGGGEKRGARVSDV